MELWEVLGEQACSYLMEEIVGTSLLGFAPEYEGDHLRDKFELLFAGDLGWNMNLDNAICPKSLNAPFSAGATDNSKLGEMSQRIVLE